MTVTNEIHVDWYSFTTRLKNILEPSETMIETVRNSIEYVIGKAIFQEVFEFSDGWQVGTGRRPYKGGYTNTKLGVNVWFGGQATILVEFTGRGCAHLQQSGIMLPLIAATHDRATRIDIAIDIDGVNRVNEIAGSIGNGRIKTIGSQSSPTGETVYIGSRKSDKFCRVYAYTSEDNPRYGQTRVEYEHKGRQARITAHQILEDGIIHTAHMIGNYYKWQCEVMQPEYPVEEKIGSVTTDRDESKRIEWLRRQVKPAIAKMLDEIKPEDPVEWLVNILLPLEYHPDRDKTE